MGKRYKEELIEREIKEQLEDFKIQGQKEWQKMSISEKEKFEQDLREDIAADYKKSYKERPYYKNHSIIWFSILLFSVILFWLETSNIFGFISIIVSVIFWRSINNYLLFEKERNRREIQKLTTLEFFTIIVPNVFYYLGYGQSIFYSGNESALFEISKMFFAFISIGFIPEFFISLARIILAIIIPTEKHSRE